MLLSSYYPIQHLFSSSIAVTHRISRSGQPGSSSSTSRDPDQFSNQPSNMLQSTVMHRHLARRPVGAARSAAGAAQQQRPWNTSCSPWQRMAVQMSATDDGPVGGEDLSDIMKQDMERLAARQQAAAAASGSSTSSGSTQQQAESGGGGLKEVVDKVLIADFFFVLAILAWLGAGLAEKATVHSSSLIDAWLPLWPLVFQPAIGVLMAGALASGGLNWLQEQQQKNK